jgi:hypothetical protein
MTCSWLCTSHRDRTHSLCDDKRVQARCQYRYSCDEFCTSARVVCVCAVNSNRLLFMFHFSVNHMNTSAKIALVIAAVLSLWFFWNPVLAPMVGTIVFFILKVVSAMARIYYLGFTFHPDKLPLLTWFDRIAAWGTLAGGLSFLYIRFPARQSISVEEKKNKNN